jgi:hypothetical protein
MILLFLRSQKTPLVFPFYLGGTGVVFEFVFKADLGKYFIFILAGYVFYFHIKFFKFDDPETHGLRTPHLEYKLDNTVQNTVLHYILILHSKSHSVAYHKSKVLQEDVEA